ncbi:hypothetical protein SteCoe_24131 [Stentor coeruleus]|uniref:Uncharacterized protein n=1 Tax=Stentor coeruleus TaxID=5963 RepID=A0A1R2BIC9_9CILI|nr:hypothetical protein SteCoe_24131 [Stentor coeruleus]
MFSDKPQLNTSITIKDSRRSQYPLLGSPYSRTLKNNPQLRSKKNREMTPSVSENQLEKTDKIIINRRPRRKTIKATDMSETYTNVEKAKYFSLKLARMLANKSVNLTYFQIYTEIFNEFADFLPEFKDLLQHLRRGLVVAALREKDFEEFEFKKELERVDMDLDAKYNKERKEKRVLANKLDLLSEEFLKVKDKYEEVQKKVVKYEKIIFPDYEEIEKNEKMILNMKNQFNILQKQKSCIHELKKIDPKLKKILDQFDIDGKLTQFLETNEQDNNKDP